MPANYCMAVEKIAYLFKYQTVFDLHTSAFSNLNPLPIDFYTEVFFLNEAEEPDLRLLEEYTHLIELIGKRFHGIAEFVSGERDIKTLALRQA